MLCVANRRVLASLAQSTQCAYISQIIKQRCHETILTLLIDAFEISKQTHFFLTIHFNRVHCHQSLCFVVVFSVLNYKTKTMEPDQMNRPQSTIAKITNFFSGGNSNTSKTLLKWKISSEQEEWTNKAVDTLVKKLKKQPNGIKNIHEVLKSKSDTSICVTIPRSIDGRLQVNFMYKLRFDEWILSINWIIFINVQLK